MTFKQINTTDKNLQLIQDNIEAALIPLETSPMAGGVFLKNVALASGSNQVSHKLSRLPTRWTVCDINAAVTIYRTAWDSKFLTLQTSGACTVSLWVS